MKYVKPFIWIVPVCVLVFFLFGFDMARDSITTIQPQIKTVQQTIKALGTVIPDESVNLVCAVAGNVENMFVRQGETVQSGQDLYTLNGVTITAPFDGSITKLHLVAGVTVPVGYPAATLSNLSQCSIQVRLKEADFTKVALDMKVLLGGQNEANKQTAYVHTKNLTLEQEFMGTYTESVGYVQLKANDMKAYTPGAMVECTIILHERENALSLPTSAFAYDENGWYVYEIVDKHAEKRHVEILLADDETVACAGVDANATIIKNAQDAVRIKVQ